MILFFSFHWASQRRQPVIHLHSLGLIPTGFWRRPGMRERVVVVMVVVKEITGHVEMWTIIAYPSHFFFSDPVTEERNRTSGFDRDFDFMQRRLCSPLRCNAFQL